MKMLIVNFCGVLCLACFSFFTDAQPVTMKKIGKNLYELKSTASFNNGDQDKLKNVLAKQYGIKSFAQAVTVHYTPVKDMQGNGLTIAEQKVSSSVFQQTILEDGDEEVKQACIYEDCKSNSSIVDIIQILSNYNIH